jgi:ACR3 family arsenite efflux pump ArsB
MALLQAAMGLALLLYEIAKMLLFVGVPLLTTLLTIKSIRKQKNEEANNLSTTDIIKIAFLNLLYAILIIISIAIILFVLLYLTIDLSDS